MREYRTETQGRLFQQPAAGDGGTGDGTGAAPIDSIGGPPAETQGGASVDAATENAGAAQDDGITSELDAVKAALAGTAGKTPAQAAPGQPVPGKQQRPRDDADFTPPGGITPEATARFARLVGRTKAAEGAARSYEQIKPEYEELKAAHEDLRKLFEEHYVDPERFSTLMGYQRLVGEGNLKEARAALFAELKRLNLEIGDNARAPDPLSDHEDLQTGVENGQLSQEHAIEIARARARDAESQQRAQQSRQTQTSADQERQLADGATQEIATWAAELRKNDINFLVKEKQILGLIDGIVQEYPARLWLPTIKRVYDSMKVGPSVTGQGGAAGVQPLRPTGGQQVSREPTSEFEAVKLAMRGTLQ